MKILKKMKKHKKLKQKKTETENIAVRTSSDIEVVSFLQSRKLVVIEKSIIAVQKNRRSYPLLKLEIGFIFVPYFEISTWSEYHKIHVKRMWKILSIYRMMRRQSAEDSFGHSL